MNMCFILPSFIAERAALQLQNPASCLSLTMVPCLTHLPIAATFVRFAQSAPGRIPVPKTGLPAPGPPRHTPFLFGGLWSQAWSFSFDNAIGSDCEGMPMDAMAELETY